ADHIEMLVTDESPKLLKVLREELSLHIELSQSNIHNLLHHMASSEEIAQSSYLKSFKKIEILSKAIQSPKIEKITNHKEEEFIKNSNLNDIKIENNSKNEDKNSVSGFKSLFSFNSSQSSNSNPSLLFSLFPLLIVLGLGGFFSVKNGTISNKLSQKSMQISAQKRNLSLEKVSENIFKAMGKNAELKQATISSTGVDIKGVVWGIEPLKNSLNKLYSGGKFVIKPLENFMTEFTFTSK
ncbi:MAG: hypothetical protein KAU90_03785, partial [Sulfurovaceae bacterium]|nr:hypothetical protein [Sulfurovaceae bacterium]